MLSAASAMYGVKPGVMALMLVVAAGAAAQAYRPSSLDRPGQALEREREMDLQALDAFEGKRSAEGFRPLERPGPWTLYGRLGLLNFKNELDLGGSGMQYSWRGTGPGLGGRIYVGIHRRF